MIRRIGLAQPTLIVRIPRRIRRTRESSLNTGGARISWRRDHRRFSPWAHVLVGFAHLNPQVANAGKNGFALQTGGGVDYFFNPRLSFRAEADYVMTKLYSQTQNNVQAGAGIVIHFTSSYNYYASKCASGSCGGSVSI